MPDTKRLSSDLITNLFQDGQAAGSITPQDMRDFIVSLLTPYGGFEMEDNATTTSLTTQNTWYKVAGATDVTNVRDMDASTIDNRIINDGLISTHFHIVATASFICSANNQEIEFAIAKNGTPVAPKQSRKAGVGADVGAVAPHADVALTTSDYVEVYARNATSAGATITVTDLYMFAMGMFGG